MSEQISAVAAPADLGNSNHSNYKISRASPSAGSKHPTAQGSTGDSLERAIQSLKEIIEAEKSSLRFEVNSTTGDIVIKVISGDGKVIREIPPEELQNQAAKMEDLTGLLFDKIC
jgi:uncharacterized FlaG/YvyC family protein